MHSPTLAAALVLVVQACSSLPDESPPLSDMEEPLTLFEEPRDEAEREALAPGAFTGIYVTDARATLESLLGAPAALVVERVVENSPADRAGVRPGDLLLEFDDGSGAQALQWPSQWRALELGAAPGRPISVTIDRAGREKLVRLTPSERVRRAERHEALRYREETHTGLVVRTATEVEARAAGLGPGAGAVLVGLSPRSPLRSAGMVFGDLIVAADAQALDHPRVLIDAIEEREAGDELELRYYREGELRNTTVRMTEREHELQELRMHPLLSYESDGQRSRLSLLLALFVHTQTKAAWRTRLFWFITLGGGDADRLEELDS